MNFWQPEDEEITEQHRWFRLGRQSVVTRAGRIVHTTNAGAELSLRTMTGDLAADEPAQCAESQQKKIVENEKWEAEPIAQAS